MFGHFLFVRFGGGWVVNENDQMNNDFILYFTTKNCVVGKKDVIWKNGSDTWFDIIANAVKCIACNNYCLAVCNVVYLCQMHNRQTVRERCGTR